jgi:hypothetical protein
MTVRGGAPHTRTGAVDTLAVPANLAMIGMQPPQSARTPNPTLVRLELAVAPWSAIVDLPEPSVHTRPANPCQVQPEVVGVTASYPSSSKDPAL